MKDKCVCCGKPANCAWNSNLCDSCFNELPSNLGSINIREETQLKAERALNQLDAIKARGPER